MKIKSKYTCIMSALILLAALSNPAVANGIEIPRQMSVIEKKMTQVQCAKGISSRDKSMMQVKYARLRSSFNKLWRPLHETYNERVRLPQQHLEDIRNLERLAAEQKEESQSFQLREAELKAEFPERMQALDRIISNQSADLEKWAGGPDVAAFINQADRLLKSSTKMRK